MVRGNAQAGFENVALWHERDISHSSAERVILPDSTTLIDYLLNKTTNLIETMFVYPERMRANLESTHGLIFSGQLLLDLVEHGVSREDAYRLVQGHAMRAWREGLDFHQLVLADKEITGKVPRKQIEYAFDLQRQLKNVDKIFARVFGSRRPAGRAGRSIAAKPVRHSPHSHQINPGTESCAATFHGPAGHLTLLTSKQLTTRLNRKVSSMGSEVTL